MLEQLILTSISYCLKYEFDFDKQLLLEQHRGSGRLTRGSEDMPLSQATKPPDGMLGDPRGEERRSWGLNICGERRHLNLT